MAFSITKTFILNFLAAGPGTVGQDIQIPFACSHIKVKEVFGDFGVNDTAHHYLLRSNLSANQDGNVIGLFYGGSSLIGYMVHRTELCIHYINPRFVSGTYQFWLNNTATGSEAPISPPNNGYVYVILEFFQA